uniref:Uncharacterized protein n=1 Tax=Anguilla anguilla TaxID=7936 RepID=A0A0E9P6N1_ANGAN
MEVADNKTAGEAPQLYTRIPERIRDKTTPAASKSVS